jgi:hypothetical protein
MMRCRTDQEPPLPANLIDHTMMMAKINLSLNHQNLDLQPHLASVCFLPKLGAIKTIPLAGLCPRNLMVSDVFGLAQRCIQETVTGFSLQNGLPKTGPKVSSTASFL